MPFIHYKKDKKNLINKYYIALIPLLIFGFYKNGILLYQHNLINLSNVFGILYFYGISIIIGIILSFLLKESYKENILICLILSATISINTNKIIYPILLFISLFIGKYLYKKSKLKLNEIAFARLLLIFSLLFGTYSYLNIGEKLEKFNYNAFDIFLGHGIGGIATTSLILLIFVFILLSTDKFYKKWIPISASLCYIGISVMYIIISKNNDFAYELLNGTIYFSYIFVAANINYSPNSRRGMIIYGILIGILSSIISILINPYEAGYLSIFLISLMIPIINKLKIVKNAK